MYIIGNFSIVIKFCITEQLQYCLNFILTLLSLEASSFIMENNLDADYLMVALRVHFADVILLKKMLLQN